MNKHFASVTMQKVFMLSKSDKKELWYVWRAAAGKVCNLHINSAFVTYVSAGKYISTVI